MKLETKLLTRTAFLLAISLIVQSLKMPQLITGSLVNVLLVVSTGTLRLFSGTIIGSLTHVIALITWYIEVSAYDSFYNSM
ncbi:MAG: hypothetical protein ACPLRZ_04510 [Thermovenabulum sp.]